MRKILMACVAMACVSPAMAAENPCAEPAMAAIVISQLNDMMTPAAEAAGISVVDVLDATTLAAPNDGIFACHLTAEFSNGMHLTGIFSTKFNSAGDILVSWKPGKASQGSRT